MVSVEPPEVPPLPVPPVVDVSSSSPQAAIPRAKADSSTPAAAALLNRKMVTPL